MRKLLIGSWVLILLCVFATQAGAIPMAYELNWEDKRIADLKSYLSDNLKFFNTNDFKVSTSGSPDTGNIHTVNLHYEGRLWLTAALPFQENKVAAQIDPYPIPTPDQDIPPVPLDLNGDSSVPEAAPVPEPATLFLLGSGMIGLVGAGRKKMKKA